MRARVEKVDVLVWNKSYGSISGGGDTPGYKGVQSVVRVGVPILGGDEDGGLVGGMGGEVRGGGRGGYIDGIVGGRIL